jgi:tRNA (mo5U34)-methyltransferase
MRHPLLACLPHVGLGAFATVLSDRLAMVQDAIYGNDRKARLYREALATLPEVRPSNVDLAGRRIRIGQQSDLGPQDRQALMKVLRVLIPWRKGPFDIFGIFLETEWDASLKWDRVHPHLESLAGRRILDIGSSSGYYMFRMSTASPALVVGIEPYLTFYFQFQLLQHFIQLTRVFTLPLRLENFPEMPGCFDTVFCMGILYHQRDPGQVLARIRQLLDRGGQLVLETLILDREGGTVLVPPGRYAKMNNVYAIPTVARLTKWLETAGFENIRCVDVTPTTLAEQRATEWIDSESLDAFLDPHDPERTVEGHPAPVRAVILARV